jgi:hypothetical protein
MYKEGKETQFLFVVLDTFGYLPKKNIGKICPLEKGRG